MSCGIGDPLPVDGDGAILLRFDDHAVIDIRSLRLDPELDRQVRRAAAIRGEENGHRTIFTLDADFHVYRLRGRHRFETIPAL